MAWTYVAQVEGGSYGDTNAMTADSTLHVEVGDVLIGVLGWRCASATTDGMDIGSGVDNFTMLAQSADDQDDYLSLGYVVVGTHNETATVRGTFSTAAGIVCLLVMQFRPDAGETITLAAGPSPATAASGTNPTSGNISPAGSDLLAWGGIRLRNEGSFSEHQIATTAADGYRNHAGLAYCAIWYKLFTANQTGIAAECTTGGGKYVIDVAALSSASASTPDPITWTVHTHRRVDFT